VRPSNENFLLLLNTLLYWRPCATRKLLILDLIISLLFIIYNNGREIEQFHLLCVDFNLQKYPSVYFVLTKKMNLSWNIKKWKQMEF